MDKLILSKFYLPLRAVRLWCLDEQRRDLGAHGTGFLVRESDATYLYTCWHVVTGYDPFNVVVGHALPNRRYLRIEMQDAHVAGEGMEAVGGLQTVTLPLYEEHDSLVPAWLQDRQHRPHPDLNAIGLHVPAWHDVVKIPLSVDVRTSSLQLVDAQHLPGNMILSPGDKVVIAGFPHGYSAVGPNQPTAAVLTRFVAATRTSNRNNEFLIDGAAAPGMSGGPVFVERSGGFFLLGIYTGLVFPDYANGSREPNDRHAALGRCTNLTYVLAGALELARPPDQAI